MSRFLIAPFVILMLGIRMPMAADVEAREGTIEGVKGLGIGALVGAIVGGPVGAVLGAAGGAYFAEQDAAKDKAIDGLEVELDSSESKLAEMRSDFEQTQVAMSGNHGILDHAPSAPLSLPVYFRTDSDAIDASLRPHLERLIAYLKSYPHLDVQLEGYSDRRGASDYNLTLSQRRIGAVRRILEDAGIEPKRILAIAYGEARATGAAGDGDAMVYDRAVVISIENSDAKQA